MIKSATGMTTLVAAIHVGPTDHLSAAPAQRRDVDARRLKNFRVRGFEDNINGCERSRAP
jgi:hypothetical protein